jgi:trimeric autotransporter adhesin
VKNIGHRLFSLGLIAATLCCLDTLDAQNTTVIATPQQLTFNTQTGVTTPSQTILLSSSSGTANVTVTAHSDNSWLTVTPASGSTPLVVTVSIGAGAPTSGVDVGFINVLSGTDNLSVPVTLNANSAGGTSPISSSPNSLSFIFPNGATAAQAQNVQLSSSSSTVTNFTATAITNDGTPWLSVNPTAGSLPGTLQVSVNPVSLLSSPGTFSAAVAINAPGTNGITIPVLVTIQGQPALKVSPSQLSFGYQLGTAVPDAEALVLSSSTGANVSFNATAQTTNCGSWIVLNQSSGATPSTLSVQVNTSGLTAGTCTGQINISAPGASNPSVMVPVSLLVSTLPLIQVPSTGPTFTYQIGGASPAPQSVQITSSTSGLNVSASASPDNGGPNFLQITSATGATPLSVTLTVNPAVLQNLAPGTYTETVTLAGSGAGNSPQSFEVTLTVSSNPILIGSAPSLNFNFQVGQTAPPNQTFTVTSSGAPLNYQVAVNTTSCTGFLKATPSNGSTFGNQNQVVVSVNPQGITPQVCSGNVTLTVPGATSAPLVIPVTFNVSNNALLSVGQSAINVTALAGAAATTKTVSVTSTSNTVLAFTATASTTPAGLTWLAVTPNTGNTPNNLQVTINPANLGPGVYNGSVVVSSSASPSQTIPVTLTIVASTAVASPTSLTFTQAAGGTAPDSQSVQIAGVPSGATIGAIPTVLTGSGWLTATASGDTVTVTANGPQLAQGTYSGVVTVIVPGAGASPLNIPVTLNVTASTSAISLSASSVSFNVLAGSMSVPGTQTVQVTTSGGGASVPFTATFVPSTGGNFLTVAPSGQNTPATIALSVDAAVSSTLSAGTYTGDVQVSSGTGAVQTVKVTLVVSPAGTPVVFSINSGASLQPGAVSPGEIVTIFGAGIGPATPTTGTSFAPTASGTVPTTLANVTVTFNNVAAPLIFVAPGQINAIVPYEVAGQTNVPVVVTNNGTTSATFTVPVTAVTPSIFSLAENGSGQGAILNSDASINGISNPAAPGTIISIYATGEGQLVPAGTTGCITGGKLPLPKPVATVAVTIGGEPASSIAYAGEAPDSVCGLIQINATLPSDLTAGPQPVVLTFGTASNTGQAITVAVK